MRNQSLENNQKSSCVKSLKPLKRKLPHGKTLSVSNLITVNFNFVGPQPLERFLYSMDTYTTGESNEEDLRFVIMGGEGKKGCYLNDLWEYSVRQNRWNQWGALKYSNENLQQKKCSEFA